MPFPAAVDAAATTDAHASAPGLPGRDGVYRPRRPEHTLLHRVVREHLQTFLAHVARTYARPLPRYVLQEFEHYLRCGIAAHGLVQVVCRGCGLQRVVPFSCKRRGICPSCAGRRMADTAARLVDSVLPDVPVRQWVLTLPWELRLPAAMRPDVLRAIVQVFVETVFRCMRRRLRRPRAGAGAIAAVHRAGGALNLNVHLHVLVLDGLFVRRPAGDIGFHRAPAPSPTELRWVVDTVRRRVVRRLGRMGLLRDERLTGEGSNESADPSALEACGQLALRAGDLEAHDGGNGRPDDVPPPRRSGRRSAHDAGFDVHAGVRVPAGDDVGRERLARYATRPPFAAERFTELPDGRIAYEVRHPIGPGKTRRVMTPVELLARLAAIVPPPRYPLLRYFGVLAANSPWRSSIVPRAPDPSASCHHATRQDRTAQAPPSATSAAPDGDDMLSVPPQPVPRTLSPEHWRRIQDGLLLARQPRVDWATLLRRTFRQDALSCPRCRGTMSPIAVVSDEAEARRILAALGLPHQPVAVAPPRDPDEPTSRGPPRADGDADGPDGLFAFDDSALSRRRRQPGRSGGGRDLILTAFRADRA